MNKFISLLIILTLTIINPSALYAETTNVIFKGTLISKTCSVSPESTFMTVDFGDIKWSDIKDLNEFSIQGIDIKVEDCPAGKIMKIKFMGDESVESGFLSLSKESNNKSIVIGIRNENGPIMLNKYTDLSPIPKGGDDTYKFDFFLKKTKNYSINDNVIGPITSTVTFITSYE